MTLAQTATRLTPFPDRSDDPGCYDILRPALRAALDFWVSLAVLPASSPDLAHTSATMAQDFICATGLPLSNGAVKGALLAVGYRPLDRSATVWHFRTRPARRVGVEGARYGLCHVMKSERVELARLVARAAHAGRTDDR